MAKEQLYCECGGKLSRPIPPTCPHCGGVIAGVRRSWWSMIWPLLLIGLMFAGLVAFLLAWTGGFAAAE